MSSSRRALVYDDRPYTVVRPHSHPTAAISVFLDGDQVERIGGCSWHVPRFSVIYRPPHVVHSNHVGKAGLRTVFVEVDPLPDLTAVACIESPKLCAMATRIGLDDFVFECVSRLRHGDRLRHPRREQTPWLEHVRQFLRDNFRRSVRLEELADVGGVHPVHLAQTFRRALKCTVGQYLRELRLTAAREELANPRRSISDIALAAGFADHAHLTRAFRARFGQTPRAYRAGLGRPPTCR